MSFLCLLDLVREMVSVLWRIGDHVYQAPHMVHMCTHMHAHTGIHVFMNPYAFMHRHVLHEYKHMIEHRHILT